MLIIISSGQYCSSPVEVCEHAGADLGDEDDGEEDGVGEHRLLRVAAQAQAAHERRQQDHEA